MRVDDSRLSFTAVWSSLCSAAALFFFAGIVVFLCHHGWPALQRHGWPFITMADWHFRGLRFGAAAMLYGTAVVALIAIVTAAPVGIAAAIISSEYLRGGGRLLVKSLIELLAGIPSVVYGLLGVLFLRPFVSGPLGFLHPETGDTLLTAGLLVGLMILPTVMSLADDAFRSVPREDRETARALGLTRSETVLHAVLPRAFPGLVAAVLLGLGRALGETIAVYLVVGRADNRLPGTWWSARPLVEAGQTITSKLGGSEINIAYGAPEHWSAMVGLSLLLCVMVLGAVLLGELTLLAGRRYRI